MCGNKKQTRAWLIVSSPAEASLPHLSISARYHPLWRHLLLYTLLMSKWRTRKVKTTVRRWLYPSSALFLFIMLAESERVEVLGVAQGYHSIYSFLFVYILHNAECQGRLHRSSTPNFTRWLRISIHPLLHLEILLRTNLRRFKTTKC